MRALIVDDEPTVRLLLSRILRREVDCAVSEATNGIEALDLLARHHYDFVVIDVMMPLMDGLETLEAIRNMPELKSLPVMVLSAVREEAQVRQLVQLGVSAYLTKPLRPSDVSARIQRFVTTLGTTTRTTTAAANERTLVGLPDGARILVVDGDADFRHFVRSTLGHQYLIVEAESGAHGLRACLEARPAAILLGQNLGAVPPGLFLRKLRSLPAISNVPVVVAGGRDRNSQPLPDADGTVLRTFVPDTFKKQFSRLIAGGGSGQRLLIARPELRPQMISATEQVFGMMLGIEIYADAKEPTAPEVGNDLARVVLTLSNEDGDLEFGITAARATSEAMTALFLQGMDVVTEEDVSATLQEVANIIAGRLQNALRGRGDEAQIGLPIVSTVAADMHLAEHWAGVSFSNGPGDVGFTTFVRPVERAVKA